jgi:hypothetical protein
MAHTITKVAQGTVGNRKWAIFDVDITTYVALGVVIPPADIGMAVVEHVMANTTEKGYDFSYDIANGKLKAWYYDYNAVADGAAIVANTGDLGTSRIMVLGY